MNLEDFKEFEIKNSQKISGGNNRNTYADGNGLGNDPSLRALHDSKMVSVRNIK